MGDAENQQQRPEAPPQQQPAMEQSAAIQTMIDVLRDQETEEGERRRGRRLRRGVAWRPLPARGQRCRTATSTLCTHSRPPTKLQVA